MLAWNPQGECQNQNSRNYCKCNDSCHSLEGSACPSHPVRGGGFCFPQAGEDSRVSVTSRYPTLNWLLRAIPTVQSREDGFQETTYPFQNPWTDFCKCCFNRFLNLWQENRMWNRLAKDCQRIRTICYDSLAQLPSTPSSKSKYKKLFKSQFRKDLVEAQKC